MIDYETFCKIHDCHDRQRLTIVQTARALGLDPRTVAAWAARSRFEPRRSRPRGSVLDPFKPRITRLLDTHPYSAQHIFQRLREEGYGGGITILRDYVRRIRPTKRPVYLKLHFAPGECAQVDWGAYGTVAVGNTRRRLSFFVMVLAFSRQMFVEFTVSQTMEHFLAWRSRAREQRLMMHFLALSPDATAYYDGLEQRRLNARHHVRKILALAEIYPADAVARAISDGLTFQAFSAEYITNILETRARALPEPGPLQLTRRHDLLAIDIAPPDLNAYEVNDHDPE